MRTSSDFEKREPAVIKDRYAVLSWRGEFHVIRVRLASDYGVLSGEIVCAGFSTFAQAQAAADGMANDHQRSSDNEAGWLCACGKPYEEH